MVQKLTKRAGPCLCNEECSGETEADAIFKCWSGATDEIAFGRGDKDILLEIYLPMK